MKNKCQYSVCCKNEAVTTISHPILKDVKVCQKCKDFYNRISKRK